MAFFVATLVLLLCHSLASELPIGAEVAESPDLALAAAGARAQARSDFTSPQGLDVAGRRSVPLPAPLVTGGQEGEVTLVSYNSFFLPAVARLLLSGWRGVQEDLRRSKSLALHLGGMHLSVCATSSLGCDKPPPPR